MAEKPVVIDTNVWSDLYSLMDTLRKKSGKSFQDLWKQSDDVVEKIISESGVLTTKRKAINVFRSIREMIHNTSDKYVIHVPIYVYNEVVRSFTSKIAFPPGTKDLTEEFTELFESIPLKVEKNESKLESGKDYPKKSEDGKNIEGIMKEFLEGEDAAMGDLFKYLKTASDQEKEDVSNKINDLKKEIKYIDLKSTNWDKPMIDATNVHGIPYEPRTRALNTLNNKIKKYEPVNKINFKEPSEIVAKRLTMYNEEFDYFDFKIYQYAKELKAPIITANTQAFQEINDPNFLKYFKDIKIMHPGINFESLADLEKSTDLKSVIKGAIEKDFKSEIDLEVCSELDRRLDTPVIKEKSKPIIKQAEKNYKDKDPKLGMSLGEVLKFLRTEKKQLKVSEKYISGQESAGKTLQVLAYVDKEYFGNHLTSDDFVIDVEVNPKVKKDLLKAKSIGQYLNDNPNVKQNLKDFEAREGTNKLELFLERYRGKTQPEFNDLFKAFTIENHTPAEEIKEALEVLPSSEPLSLEACPEARGPRKRETAKCLLEWEDIDQFNEEKTAKRDPLKVKIDSEKFLEYLKTVKDPQERKQLIDFVDQVLVSSGNYESKLSGAKIAEVVHIINAQKVLDHFGKVHRVSSALNHGIFAMNILADLLAGEYKGVAINIGFMGGNYFFSRLAKFSFSLGVSLAEAGRLMVGTSLKYASPFIKRFLTPIIALDLYHQIKALKAGDKEAIAGIVGDSIFLTIDAVDIGVDILEISGLIVEVSSVTGPIGETIGALTIVGLDIYSSVRKVQIVDKVMHLSTMEKWEMGVVTFFTFGLKKMDVEERMSLKIANDQLAQQALDIMKKSPGIQRMIVPSGEWHGAAIRTAYNNWFLPFSNGYDTWYRERPDDPQGGRVFCAPLGDTPAPSWIMGQCTNALGVVDLTPKKENITLFNLGDGYDYVKGFSDSPNMFLFGKDYKDITGGDKNDVFIVEVNTTFREFPRGNIYGAGGSNMLDLKSLKGGGLAVFFEEEPLTLRIAEVTNLTSLTYNSLNKITFSQFHSVIGRENEVDFIYTNCSTSYVDGKGGRPDFADQIHISHTYKECNHDKLIKMGPNTMVINEAVTGNFTYLVDDIHSDTKCTLRRSPPFKNLVKDPEKNRIDHKFFINGKLHDIVKIDFHHEKDDKYDVDFQIFFKDDRGKTNKFHLDTVLGHGKNNGGMDNVVIYLKDSVELRYHHNGVYALLQSNTTVPNIINQYQPIAVALGISIFVFTEIENINKKEAAIVSIGSDQKDDVLYNDPTHKTFLVANKGNNVYMIVSGNEFLYGSKPPVLPSVEIFNSHSKDNINALDLHYLSKQIKRDLDKDLLIKHVFDTEKLVIYLYTVGSDRRSYDNVTSITFRNLPKGMQWDAWCRRLHVFINRAPVVLKCDESYKKNFGQSININNDVIDYRPWNYYTPLPLEFSGFDVIVLDEDDVEYATEVIVRQKIGVYRYLRLQEDLVFTNGFDFKTPDYHPTTIVCKNFYKNPSNVFFSLKFTFSDKSLYFVNEIDEVREAASLGDVYSEYESISDRIMGNVTKRSKRNLEGKEDVLIKKEITHSKHSQAAPGLLRNVFDSLTDIYHKSYSYVHGYFKSMTGPDSISNFHAVLHSHAPNEHTIPDQRLLGSKENIPLSNESKISFINFNSTLLLLDTLVRKLNDSKYKQPKEAYLLSPQEQVERKMVELTKKLGLDYNDVVGSMEKQRKRILENMQEK